MILGPLLSPDTGDYILSEGQILNGNALFWEMYNRFVTKLGTYPFDDTFGIELDQKRFNSRVQVQVAYRDALNPMVQQNKILDPILTVQLLPLSKVVINVQFTDPSTLQLTYFKFPPISVG